jgi:BON domain
MKALIAIGCGAIAAACASNRAREEPAHFSKGDSTTVTMRPADAPSRGAAPAYGDSRAPSDSASSAGTDPKTANSELATLRAPVPSTPAPAAQTTPQPGADDAVVSKKNQAGATPTVLTQGASDVDVMITQQILKSIATDSSLSVTSKNIQVITQGGKVTLRGVVRSAGQRKSVDDSARKIAGAANVDNQLEVTK